MKKLSTLLAISALAFGISMPAWAAPAPKTPSADATPPTGTPAPTIYKSASIPFHGDVSAVDSATKSFTLKSKDGRERVFHVGENAKPAKEGWSGEFSTIVLGAHASGTCTKTGYRGFEITTLHIAPKGVKKITPAPKATATPAPKATATPKPGATPKPS